MKQTNWLAKLNGGEFKVMRLQDAPLREVATLDTSQAALPNARADLPRIEDVNRESGCEGDNRG